MDKEIAPAKAPLTKDAMDSDAPILLMKHMIAYIKELYNPGSNANLADLRLKNALNMTLGDFFEVRIPKIFKSVLSEYPKINPFIACLTAQVKHSCSCLQREPLAVTPF